MPTAHKSRVLDMTQGDPFRLVLQFSMPLFCSNLLQQLYNLTDTALAGHLLGAAALAQIGATAALYGLIMNFAFGMNNGLALTVSRYFGAGDESGMRRAVGWMVTLSVTVSLVLTGCSLLGRDALLTVLQVPAQAWDGASAYLTVILLGIPLTMLYNMEAALLRAVGNSVTPLLFLLFSSVLNVGLDAAFMGPLGLGVRGAAIATVLAQGISAVLGVVYLLRGYPELHFTPRLLGAAAPHAVQPYTLPDFAAHPAGVLPALMARFATVAQCPAEYAEPLQLLVFPLSEAAAVPAAWRKKTLLELPRITFGTTEAKTAAAVAALNPDEFGGLVINNPAQLRYTKNWRKYGGLGLNVTNPMSAARYAALGLQGMLLQPETALSAMQEVAPGVPTAALCYAHLPLMLTRACPLRNVHTCAECTGTGTLRDRKGRDFTVTCSAPGGAGLRTVFNPVPLYMGERLTEMPVDYAVAAFTTESPARTAQILAALFARQPFDAEFTRGLYYTNN